MCKQWRQGNGGRRKEACAGKAEKVTWRPLGNEAAAKMGEAGVAQTLDP